MVKAAIPKAIRNRSKEKKADLKNLDVKIWMLSVIPPAGIHKHKVWSQIPDCEAYHEAKLKSLTQNREWKQ